MASGKATVSPSLAWNRWRRMALVVSLLFHRRPAHIARFVVAVIVDAVKRVFWRGLPADISEKGFVRLPPAVADRDASATVLPESRVLRVVTALLHTGPRMVFGCLRAMECIAVGYAVDLTTETARVFSPQTTTASRVLSCVEQASRRQDAFRSAVADTTPHGTRTWNRSTFQHQQPTESPTVKINGTHQVHFIVGWV